MMFQSTLKFVIPLFLVFSLENSISFVFSPSFCGNARRQPTRTKTAIFSQPSAVSAIDRIKKESLESLLPKEDVLSIISELSSNHDFIDDTESFVSKYWDSLDRRLRSEERTVSEIIGKETSNRLLRSIKSVDGYDPDAVRSFLGSEAINSLFATILYDAIFEFFQRIDVFGNIINSLPIIGPMRRQIIAETKKSLDRSLGPLVKNFLKTYTKIAVLQASDYILSPANSKAFGGANARLVSNLLERPVNSLIPSSETTNKIKGDAVGYLRNIDLEAVDRYLDFIYETLGDKSVESVIDTNKVLDASPTLRKTVDSIWDKALGETSKNSIPV